MLQAVQLYTQHTLLGVLIEGMPSVLNALDDLVNKVGISIISKAIITVPLFHLHHNLFALGFAVGFVFDNQVREVVEKVNIVYDAQKTFFEQVLFYSAGGFLAILTMPTSLILATLYYSAQWGALLYQKSKSRYPIEDYESDIASEIDGSDNGSEIPD